MIGNACLRVAEVAQEEAVRPDDVPERPAEREREADRPVQERRRSRSSSRIFATTVPAFLPREKPISRNAKPACMNITRQPATITQIELMPTESGSPLPAHRRCRPGRRPARAARATALSASARTANERLSHGSSMVEWPRQSRPRRAARLWPGVERSRGDRFATGVETARTAPPSGRTAPRDDVWPLWIRSPGRRRHSLERSHRYALAGAQEDLSALWPGPASRTSPPRSGPPTAPRSAPPTSPRPAARSSARTSSAWPRSASGCPRTSSSALQAHARSAARRSTRRSPTPSPRR